MKQHITFLHTADAHTKTFDQLFEDIDVELTHVVRPDWLELAIHHGISNELHQQVSSFLNNASANSDAVVCTCSTLAPIADQIADDSVFRVDQPMMAAAAANGPVAIALCLESTRESSLKLLTQAFAQTSRPAAYRVIDCRAAWPLFEANQQSEFAESVATIIKQAVNSEDGCVVLAQASMAPAEDHLAELAMPVYSSPALAVDWALKILNSEFDSHGRAYNS